MEAVFCDTIESFRATANAVSTPVESASISEQTVHIPAQLKLPSAGLTEEQLWSAPEPMISAFVPPSFSNPSSSDNEDQRRLSLQASASIRSVSSQDWPRLEDEKPETADSTVGAAQTTTEASSQHPSPASTSPPPNQESSQANIGELTSGQVSNLEIEIDPGFRGGGRAPQRPPSATPLAIPIPQLIRAVLNPSVLAGTLKCDEDAPSSPSGFAVLVGAPPKKKVRVAMKPPLASSTPKAKPKTPKTPKGKKKVEPSDMMKSPAVREIHRHFYSTTTIPFMKASFRSLDQKINTERKSGEKAFDPLKREVNATFFHDDYMDGVLFYARQRIPDEDVLRETYRKIVINFNCGPISFYRQFLRAISDGFAYFLKGYISTIVRDDMDRYKKLNFSAIPTENTAADIVVRSSAEEVAKKYNIIMANRNVVLVAIETFCFLADGAEGYEAPTGESVIHGLVILKATRHIWWQKFIKQQQQDDESF